MDDTSTSGGQSFLLYSYIHRADLPAEPQTPRRRRPAVPRAAVVEDNLRGEEVIDEDGNLHIHLTMPAQLAREVEWSFHMSPRSRTPASNATSPRPPSNRNIRPDIAPLRFNRENVAIPPARRRAPPSPPPSPSPPPPSPSPPPPSPSPSPPPPLRVPDVAPPVVSSLFTPQYTLSNVSNPSAHVF